jgi:AraC-like DNA-binding protein
MNATVDMAIASSKRNLLVKAMWAASGDAMDVVLPGVIAPDAHVEFVFHLGNPGRQQRAGESRWRLQPRSFVLPMSHGALRLAGEGYASIIAFRVSPVVALRILGQPLHDIWNEPVPLHHLIGGEADALSEHLATVPTGERFELLHLWIERRLSSWDAAHLRVHQLFDRVMWSAPMDRLPVVARNLGWSERSLRRVITQATGMSPKEIQLAGRHLDACALLREHPALDITEVAGRAGFFDHAAFAHSFRQRLGMTPSQFRAEAHAHFERRP